MASTYSFKDISFVFKSPSVGQKQVNGQNIGDISVAMTDNLTEQDLSNDGEVMTSKVESSRGTITLQIQQASTLCNWLVNWVNAMRNGSSSTWNEASISLKENFTGGRSVNAVGVSPMKIPDHKSAQQGQKEEWQFACQKITQS